MNTKRLEIFVFFLSISFCVLAQEGKFTTTVTGNHTTVINNFINQLADYKTPDEIEEIKNMLESFSGQSEQQNEQLRRLLQQLMDYNANTHSTIVNLKDSIMALNEKIQYLTQITEMSNSQINAITDVIITPLPEPKMAFGFCFGSDFTNMFITPSLKTTKMIFGGNLGVIIEKDFGRKAIQFGLLYATRGCEFEGDFMDFTKGIFELKYLYIIPTFLYKFDNSNSDETPFLRGRLYWGYGISGKIKEVDGTEEKVEKVKFGEDAKLNNPDFGFGLGLGWQFNRLQVVFEGNLGLNISNDDNIKINNYGFALAFAWKFNNISRKIFK